MNYKNIYDSIIKKAKEEELNGYRSLGYFEKHHILPKSLGGSNDKENLVKLTAREHFICHALLIRFLTGKDLYKMKWAFHQMCTWSIKSDSHIEKYVNSAIYESFKRNFQKGENNSQFGKRWYYNTLTGESKKFNNLPSGEWKPGRKFKEEINRVRKNSSITTAELAKRTNLILNSDVDLTKFGWQTKVSKLTGLTKREIYYAIKNSDILKTKVYVRK